jgi:hypothetical protein
LATEGGARLFLRVPQNTRRTITSRLVNPVTLNLQEVLVLFETRMPTQLNRLFRLYAVRKKASAQDMPTTVQPDREPSKKGRGVRDAEKASERLQDSKQDSEKRKRRGI